MPRICWHTIFTCWKPQVVRQAVGSAPNCDAACWPRGGARLTALSDETEIACRSKNGVDSNTAAPICGQQRAPRWWLIGRSEDGTYCKIVVIWRPSAFDLVGRNIWTPRRNFAV